MKIIRLRLMLASLLWAGVTGPTTPLSAAEIICTDYNDVCEIVGGEDIGVSWGVIQQWEMPAWNAYIMDMSYAQSNYLTCRKEARKRRDDSKADALGDFELCTAAAIANSVRCMINCMKTLKIPKACAAFCAGELAGLEAICLMELNTDRINWQSQLEKDYAICESNRARERGRAAERRNQYLDRIRP